MNMSYPTYVREKWPALAGLLLCSALFVYWLPYGVDPGILSAFYIFHWHSNSHYELIYGGILLGIFLCFLSLLLPINMGFMRMPLAIQGGILEISLFCKINLNLIFLYHSGKTTQNVKGIPLVVACILLILFLIRYETNSSWKEICQGLVGNFIGSMLLALIIFDSITIHRG